MDKKTAGMVLSAAKVKEGFYTVDRSGSKCGIKFDKPIPKDWKPFKSDSILQEVDISPKDGHITLNEANSTMEKYYQNICSENNNNENIIRAKNGLVKEIKFVKTAVCFQRQMDTLTKELCGITSRNYNLTNPKSCHYKVTKAFGEYSTRNILNYLKYKESNPSRLEGHLDGSAKGFTDELNLTNLDIIITRNDLDECYKTGAFK